MRRSPSLTGSWMPTPTSRFADRARGGPRSRQACRCVGRRRADAERPADREPAGIRRDRRRRRALGDDHGHGVRRPCARRRRSGSGAREVEAAARDRRGGPERPLHRRRQSPADLRSADRAEALWHQSPGPVPPLDAQLPDDAREPALRPRRARGEEYEDAEGLEVSTAGYRSARSGPKPSKHAAKSDAEQLDLIAADIARWIAEGDRPETIAILASSNSAAKKVQQGLGQRDVAVALMTQPRITGGQPVAMTMHTAKGMEFSRVVLFDVSDGSFPPRGRTRACRRRTDPTRTGSSARCSMSPRAVRVTSSWSPGRVRRARCCSAEPQRGPAASAASSGSVVRPSSLNTHGASRRLCTGTR